MKNHYPVHRITTTVSVLQVSTTAVPAELFSFVTTGDGSIGHYLDTFVAILTAAGFEPETAARLRQGFDV